ncbi:MAG: hypothetical protein WC365_03675 [Candidatus Babeliales bacterium]|jgi:hypothetical protein
MEIIKKLRPEIATGALLQVHRDCGLRLVQITDHIISLETQNGSRIAYFSYKAPILEIRNAANDWMMHTDLISYAGVK